MDINPSLFVLVRCPDCFEGALRFESGTLRCERCGGYFPVHNGVASLLSTRSRTDPFKEDMRSFWGKGWDKRRLEDTSVTTRERYRKELEGMREFVERENGEQVREMGSIELAGKRVLEVGCGAGSSSVMFALRGASVVAVDLTEDALFTTRQKFQLLELPGEVLQADAEELPFGDATFDVVFSSGVLHHTPNTDQAIHEIDRVLKPGGHAVVMLYAKGSFQYLVHLFLVRGLLLGGFFHYGRSRWLGSVTEANWHTKDRERNPLTKVYSVRAMKRLFHSFEIISLRKHGFNWADILPGMYRFLKRKQVWLGDSMTMLPSHREVRIGRWAGFSLVIHARKPGASS